MIRAIIEIADHLTAAGSTISITNIKAESIGHPSTMEEFTRLFPKPRERLSRLRIDKTLDVSQTVFSACLIDGGLDAIVPPRIPPCPKTAS